MKRVEFLLILLFVAFAGSAVAQKQIVLLKKEKVLLRLYPGDEFIYRLKGDDQKRTTYINNLSDTSVVTHRDTVPFHTIDRIYFQQKKFYNTVGTALVIFGAGLFFIDQFNHVIVQGNSPNLDSRVSTISLASVGAGIPMMLIRKKSQKLGYRVRLMVVEESSPFYRPDTRQIISND